MEMSMSLWLSKAPMSGRNVLFNAMQECERQDGWQVDVQ